MPFAAPLPCEATAFLLLWNGIPLELHLLRRCLSDTFFYRLRIVLFNRAGVGGAPLSSCLEEVLCKSLNADEIRLFEVLSLVSKQRMFQSFS